VPADPPNPCETGSPSLDAFPEAEALSMENPDDAPAVTRSKGLAPVDPGLIVHDANQGVCWLADYRGSIHPIERPLSNASLSSRREGQL
jgi:hypothetical protein